MRATASRVVVVIIVQARAGTDPREAARCPTRKGKEGDEPVYVARTRVRRAGRGFSRANRRAGPAVEGGESIVRVRRGRARAADDGREGILVDGMWAARPIKSVRCGGARGRRRTREVASVARGGHRARMGAVLRLGRAFGRAEVRRDPGRPRARSRASKAKSPGSRAALVVPRGKVRREGSSARGRGDRERTRARRARVHDGYPDSNRPIARFQVIRVVRAPVGVRASASRCEATMMHATLHVIISREIQTGAYTNCESVLPKNLQSRFFRARLLRKCAIWATVRDRPPSPAFPDFIHRRSARRREAARVDSWEKVPGRPATTRTPAVA